GRRARGADAVGGRRRQARQPREPRGAAGQGRRRAQGSALPGCVHVHRAGHPGCAHHRGPAREAGRRGRLRPRHAHPTLLHGEGPAGTTQEGTPNMAKLSTEELIEAFKELTLIELSEFVKQLEETFEVTAAAPVAVAAAGAPAAGGGDAGGAAEEEKSEFDVILEAIGDKKIQV